MRRAFTLIGGALDGEVRTVEADNEYVVFPVPPRMAAADVVPGPRAVDGVSTFEKAIYTRRHWRPDRFEPLICFAAVELTDREMLTLLIEGYRSR